MFKRDIRLYLNSKLGLILFINEISHMIQKPNAFYTYNLLFGIFLFLITVTVRTKIVYGAVDNVGLASMIITIWNWFMLLSLAIAALQSLAFTYKNGGIRYVFISILVIICLIITFIGMFLIPSGAILS